MQKLVRPGSVIILGRHDKDGLYRENWVPDMEYFVGKEVVVRYVDEGYKNHNEYNTIAVSVRDDSGQNWYAWHLKNALLVKF